MGRLDKVAMVLAYWMLGWVWVIVALLVCVESNSDQSQAELKWVEAQTESVHVDESSQLSLIW